MGRRIQVRPAIRERENRERLWAALGEGVLDMIVSDHSPAPPELSSAAGDFARAWADRRSADARGRVDGGEQRGYPSRIWPGGCAGPAKFAGLADGRERCRGEERGSRRLNPEAQWTSIPRASTRAIR
jgi:allantoinase